MKLHELSTQCFWRKSNRQNQITFLEYTLGSVSDPKKTDTAQMRSVVTAMEELESSRQKLADNLDRNVRHEVISLYNGTDNQSCKTIKESKKSLDKIADDHEEKLLKERVPTSSLSYNLFYNGTWIVGRTW